MANSTFYYKALRDIISTVIGIFFAIVVFFIIRYALPPGLCLLDKTLSAEDNDIHGLINFFTVLYLIFVIPWITGCIASIYSNTYRKLFISQDEIVYSHGMFKKTTISIPSNKIRTCSKYSTVLQRVCNTMTISITTAGDSDEIRFENIGNGEEAYRLIRQMAKRNEAY